MGRSGSYLDLQFKRERDGERERGKELAPLPEIPSCWNSLAESFFHFPFSLFLFCRFTLSLGMQGGDLDVMSTAKVSGRIPIRGSLTELHHWGFAFPLFNIHKSHVKCTVHEKNGLDFQLGLDVRWIYGG